MAFYVNDHNFTFRINKDRGKAILYSIEHTDLRKQLLNKLPQPLKIPMLTRKLDLQRVWNKVQSILKTEYGVVVEASLNILDIIDIGMGHSIYHVILEHSHKQYEFVVKRESLPMQSFYCQLLDALDWPSFKSWHFVGVHGKWEITEYLGATSLHEHLVSGKSNHDDELIRQLAYQAALGDVCGRGDRHFENYIYFNGNVLPVDISYLFWDGNDDWCYKYIAGGLYEINYLMKYIDDEKTFENKINLFFDYYTKALHDLSQKIIVIERLINNYFELEDADTYRKLRYIQERLLKPIKYIEKQKKLYLDGLDQAKIRLSYKQKLQAMAKRDIASVKANDRLWMYYLVDKNRASNFFLLDEQPDGLLDLIK
jgi:hypothetical protein